MIHYRYLIMKPQSNLLMLYKIPEINLRRKRQIYQRTLVMQEVSSVWGTLKAHQWQEIFQSQVFSHEPRRHPMQVTWA